MSRIPPEPEELKRVRLYWEIKKETYRWYHDEYKFILIAWCIAIIGFTALLLYYVPLDEKPRLRYSIHCIDGTKHILFNRELQPHLDSDGNLSSCE